MANAYLLYGRPPVEFADPIRNLLKALVCEENHSSTKGCGNCAQCKQADQLTHPDIVAPGTPRSTDDLEPDDRVGVQTVRDRILEASSLTPARCRYKIFWLHDLSRFTVEASNSLLKVLEEPPGEAIFLLTSRSRWDCLPTIRSRCQWIRLPRNVKSFDSFVEKCKARLSDDIKDEDLIENWCELLRGESRSHKFNWSRSSTKSFLEFILLAINELYTESTKDASDESFPEERLSYRLIPDILDRLDELERGGNPSLIVNSLLEEIFYPEETQEWANVI